MRYFIALLLLFSLAALTTGCGGDEDNTDGPVQPSGWTSDIEWLRDSLPPLHFNLFLYQPADGYNAALDRLQDEIGDMTDWEIVMEMTRIVAAQGCSHTGVGFFEYGSFGGYPLSVWWLDSGLYVTAVDIQYSQLLGARLIRYGDRSAIDAAEAMAEMFPARNSTVTRTWATNFLMMSEPMEALGFGNVEEGTDFTFETASGDTITERMTFVGDGCVRMTSFIDVPTENLPLYLQGDYFYWFRHLPEEGILYIAYNTCAEVEGYPMADLVDDLDQLMEREDIRGVVVDLRRNTGGNSLVAAPLISWLERISSEGGVQMFLVVGRWTYSSGILNALEILECTDALLVGEETSGAPNHLGEVQTAVLPWSGLSVSYPIKYFVTVEGDGSTLSPEISIPLSPQALFGGRDQVMETIADMLQ